MVNYIEATANINKLRMLNTTPFSYKSMKSQFSEKGITTAQLFWKQLLLNKIILKNNRNTYKFCEHPIHINLITKCYSDYLAQQKVYTDNYRARPKEKSIERAINLLKSSGYRIQKPMVTYKEI